MTELTLADIERAIVEASPQYQRAKAAADDFTGAMERLVRESGATPEHVAGLARAVEEMGAVSGFGRSYAAEMLTDLFRGPREYQEHWARLLPDVAALGNDSPHISVREGPCRGDLVWSWFTKGCRVYQQPDSPSA